MLPKAGEGLVTSLSAMVWAELSCVESSFFFGYFLDK